MLIKRSIPWCNIIVCNNTRASLMGARMSANSSDAASCDSNRHFCVRVLHDTINQTKYVVIIGGISVLLAIPSAFDMWTF